MSSGPVRIREIHGVTAAQFRQEIVPSGVPAVLRGVVGHWPAVAAGRASPAAMANYLSTGSSGAPVHVMVGDPAINGRFFYNDALTGLNHQNVSTPFRDVLNSLVGHLGTENPPAIYAGAIAIPAQLPGFTRENPLDLLDPAIEAKIWLGNRVTVQTHFDLSFNVACVVAGRRRFTLIPPDQIENMYVGPLEFTLAGPPVSMVQLDPPDFEKFPRFRAAWAAAQVADLEPGDALFIPYMWWHHVESRDKFNVLVNYWWDESPAWQGSPFPALMHAILSVRNLPPAQRDIWRQQFEHFVFSGGEQALAHLTESQRGVQGPPTPQRAQMIRSYLAQVLAIIRGKGS
jgi:hypothetical protein